MSNLELAIDVAETMEDITLALMIRSAVFVGECETHQIEDERDGQDHSATHLIARVQGAPAGTMRIRYFPKFAVFERLAVVKSYRTNRFTTVTDGKNVRHTVATALQSHAMGLIVQKGYKEFTGKALPTAITMWKRSIRKIGDLVEVENSHGEYMGQHTEVIHGQFDPAKIGLEIDTPENLLHSSVSRKEGEMVNDVYAKLGD